MLEQDERVKHLKSLAQFHPNFPKAGVNFMDVFPIVAEPKALQMAIDIFAQRLSNVQFDKIIMLESKGFLFGAGLSLKTGKPCYPIRKKGKLPGQCVGVSYGLEYGKDEVELQRSVISKGEKVILIDDVLATGGTLNAGIELVEKLEGEVTQILLLTCFQDLKGMEKLKISKDKVFYMWGA